MNEFLSSLKTLFYSLFSRIWDVLKRAFQHEVTAPQFAMACFSTLLLFGFFYRLRICSKLFFSPGAYPSFPVTKHSFIAVFGFLWMDILFSLFVTAFVWLLAYQSDEQTPAGKAWLYVRLLVFHVVLLLIALIYGAHQQVMFAMQSGLTYDMLLEAQSAFAIGDLLSFLTPVDVIMLAFPIAVFWCFVWLPPSWRTLRNNITYGLLGLTGFLFLTLSRHANPPLERLIADNPVVYVVRDIIQHVQNTQRPMQLAPTLQPKQQATQPPPTHQPSTSKQRLHKQQLHKHNLTPPIAGRQQASTNTRGRMTVLKVIPKFQVDVRSVYLPAPLYAHPVTPPKRISPGKGKKWNVVFLLLESTGMRYMLRKTQDGRDIMPFFKKWYRQGWLFKKHYSPSNSSPRSIFSIYSGLYPTPHLRMYATSRDASVPSLHSFLGPRYDSFLVTPGPLRWYFPKWFLQNSGLKEMYGYYSLPFRTPGPGRIVARNEIQVTDFFIKRLKSATEPFFASYLSFVPHYPYTDYGPKHRLIKQPRHSLHRYYNNLHMLDQQLERIVNTLKELGKLKRTLIVVAGDHGEAFGQHKGNYTHSRRSYNENYHTVFFMYQPRIFRPRVSYRVTSHVDIVPTVLDAVGIPYNRKLFQGESLFQASFQRKQIFLYGNENTLSSIHENKKKMQISFRYRRCWMYDLKVDPSERRRLGCQQEPAQKQLLLRYHQEQQIILKQYNKARKAKQPVFGLKHPRLH